MIYKCVQSTAAAATTTTTTTCRVYVATDGHRDVNQFAVKLTGAGGETGGGGEEGQERTTPLLLSAGK